MSHPQNRALEAKEAAHPAHVGGRLDSHGDRRQHAADGIPHTKLEHGEQMMSEHERAALAEVGASPEFAPGTPERLRIEKRLKRKLDARFSILVSLSVAGSLGIVS
jgi:hypothetical protein